MSQTTQSHVKPFLSSKCNPTKKAKSLCAQCRRIREFLGVIGIKWRLENTAVGKATFDIKAPLSRRDTAREKATKVRKIWVRDIPEESRLVFDIVDTVPRLEASFESSDGSFADASSAVVLDGSISKVNVAIRNVSDATARHVRIRLPSNAFTPCESEVHRTLKATINMEMY